MNISLNSKNYNKEHSFDIVSYNNELLFVKNNKVVATIRVDTMCDEDNKATKNFWLCFNSQTPCDLDKNFASVICSEEVRTK